ncbi:ABC transporter ATP-binding protein [Mobiluncus mulieris]|uniref:ABC transporter ATP-binding protein n=1 Tax=Mobiluncus mulieris TaxID=2052 RepID=A0A7Y0UTG1_9ACTO|nr:ABC transporter ATP-binding protein [Mobiluncus mulieris]MCU9976468.1 ABC transporter ATP-binding protein [Mobiluncus mulieris]NMW62209.1 ABC transporter ATP-binding protein [Mobiluncus mulieris]NMX03412.1 ABC transporter ATP-binding protein [Mobiluncus mulieris]NMX11980.1 ABC transporter ATP-binding protein [Mobiluncus mulieris]
MALFDINNISFRYHSKQGDILKGVSYTVESGDYLAIMGPSGSGKTTLLKCIAGLLSPTGGEVLYKGKDTTRVKQSVLNRLRRTDWGFVFQEYNLVDAINVVDNVRLPAYFNHQRLSKDAVMAALESVNLGSFASRFPDELSGGQQQRVAIARAIASKREVVFADEPTGALDSKSSKEVISNLTELNKTGATVLMVTHDPMVAAAAAKVLFLYDGRIVQQGNYQSAQEISNILLDMENANA